MLWIVAHQVPLSIGILQARILEWVAIPSSRGSFQPRNQTRVSCIAGGLFTQDKTTIKGETDHRPMLDAWDKCSGLVHWEDPEGWDGEGGGRGRWDGEYMQIHGWFMSMYGKNHYNKVISLQLTKINGEKKKKRQNKHYQCHIKYAL